MKKVFEYMNWCNTCESSAPCCGIGVQIKTCATHPLNGNDMVLAINAMRDKGDWDKFFNFFYNKVALIADVVGNPENFFKLMEEWLEKEDKI